MNFKPGDLVMIVKPPKCGCTNRVGHIGVVGLPSNHERFRCLVCGEISKNTGSFWIDEKFVCQPNRLIKIDPLTEQEKTEATEEA